MCIYICIYIYIGTRDYWIVLQNGCIRPNSRGCIGAVGGKRIKPTT